MVQVTAERIAAGSIAEAEIHGQSSKGAGVGKLEDGRAVFVPRTAPGDRVRIRLSRVKPRWAEGSLLEVLRPSPHRRAPLCARYDTCGGCQLQHLPETQQRVWKARIVQDALQRIGGLGEIDEPEVVESPRSVGYRNRMSFTLRRLPGGRVVAGLHALGRPTHVVEIHEECVLPEEEIGAAWRALRNGWGAGADRLPAGGRLRLTLRLDAERRVVLVVSGGDPSWKPDRLLARVPALAAVVHRSGDKDEQAADPAAVDVSLGFEQVNDGAAALLRAHVLAEAADVRRAVDAYCGAGPYGRALAEQGVSVIGIELDPEAGAEAVRGAPEGFEVRTGSVEELLPRALPTELLIVNPPRTGLGADVVATITADPPERLIYVSCDPATLARDLAGLASRYEIGGVRCFDLFPQTAHIETVVRLNLSSER